MSPTQLPTQNEIANKHLFGTQAPSPTTITVLGHLDNARMALRSGLMAYGDTFDDFSREVLSACDAIDRARKRLKEKTR